MAKLRTDAHAAAARTELQAIRASSNDAIIGLTPLGVIKSWNPAATRLYGYSPEEIIGRPSDVLVAPGRRAEEAQILSRLIDHGPAERHLTSRIDKDGTSVAVSVTTSTVVNSTRAVVGLVMVSRRLDPLPDLQGPPRPGLPEPRLPADAEQDLQHAQLLESERMEVLGRLAGGVAHDFNNLLGVILNYAAFVSEELTASGGSAPDWEQRRQGAQHDVGQIRRAAERATDLTHQLLAFARREVVQPQVLNLNDKVNGVEELLRRTLGSDMELFINLADALWPILADPGQIEQILVNLAINASDAMPGGGNLRIDTANVTVDADSVAGGSRVRPGRYVRLRVSDTGAGMSAEVVSHAFEPFYTTKADGGGTGLGLATVHGIVTQADGAITIKSEIGAGTTFTIMLPVTDEAAAAMDEPAPYLRSPNGETVLVVEDEMAMRAVTERIFARNGYHVLTASGGADALALIARHEGPIHLLVTDVVMPRMLGKELAERVRELVPDIEVLFMSGYAQPVLASQGRLEPGVALVDKPFSEAALMAKAGRVLDGYFRKFKAAS
jgi:PAS domain S-box-containing protein